MRDLWYGNDCCAEATADGGGPTWKATASLLVVLGSLVLGLALSTVEIVRRHRRSAAAGLGGSGGIQALAVTLAVAALLQMVGFSFYYTRYRRCNALFGYRIFMLVSIVTGQVITLMLRYTE